MIARKESFLDADKPNTITPAVLVRTDNVTVRACMHISVNLLIDQRKKYFAAS